MKPSKYQWGGKPAPSLVRGEYRMRRLATNRELRDRIYDLRKTSKRGCCYCKCKVMRSDATLEHIIPLVMGGTNAYENLEIACGPCNKERGTSDWATFLAMKRGLPVPIKKKTKPPAQVRREARAERMRHLNNNRLSIKEALLVAYEMGWPAELSASDLEPLGK